MSIRKKIIIIISSEIIRIDLQQQQRKNMEINLIDANWWQFGNLIIAKKIRQL